MVELGQKLVGALAVIAVIVGLKVYNKAQDKSEVMERFVEICAGEQACLDDVETYFEPCFDSAYNMGGRRRSPTLDAERLASCLNSESGTEWFAYDESAD